MNSFLKSAAAIATAIVVATSAHATTFVYGLTDHPGGQLAGTYDYGLRLDTNPSGGTWADGQRFFSFGSLDDLSATPVEADFTAFLIYNSANATAEITGTMVESLGNNMFGNTYEVSYSLGGVFVETDTNGAATGFFHDVSGMNGGTLSRDGERIELLKAKRDDGEYFNFDGAVRRHVGGEGWVGGVPANDFLFTATFISNTPPGQDDPTVTPLPAAGWMLLAGLGGIGLMRRRRKPS